MIVSLYGIEKKLITNNTSISVLNINNSILYRSIIRFLRLDLLDETKNEVVFFENQERINGKEIVYIQDLYSYKFDSKLISEKVIKSYIQEVNYDINDKIEISLNGEKIILKKVKKYTSLDDLFKDYRGDYRKDALSQSWQKAISWNPREDE